jgi:hypothetical protein
MVLSVLTCQIQLIFQKSRCVPIRNDHHHAPASILFLPTWFFFCNGCNQRAAEVDQLPSLAFHLPVSLGPAACMRPATLVVPCRKQNRENNHEPKHTSLICSFVPANTMTGGIYFVIIGTQTKTS